MNFTKTQSTKRFGRSKDYAIVFATLSLALFSRLYSLNDFPYFPPQYPWVGGGSGEIKGLYIDEYAYYGYAVELIKEPSLPLIYQPWLQLLFMGASASILGESSFAIRLPSAVMSSISAALVYLICIKKFKSKLAARLSSLYYIVMAPALILNRMAFLENGAATFFLASFYALLKYSEGKRDRWLLTSVVFAGSSVLCKINGIIAPIFLVLYLIHSKALVKNIKYVFVCSAIILIFPTIISIRYELDLLQLISQFIQQWQLGTIGIEASVWQYLLFNSMPSGYIVKRGLALALEYWYIFAYFALAYLAVTEFKKVSDITLAILSFIGLFLVATGYIGVYYLVLIQPFLAIPTGYAIIRLTRMPSPTALFFYFFLYAPMILDFDILNLSGGAVPPVRGDLVLTVLKLLRVLLPLLLLFSSSILKDRLPEFPKIVNNVLLALFFIFLFVGSYIVPAFYPHYLLQP